jgi:predicted MFS family arabinose efflux permease
MPGVSRGGIGSASIGDIAPPAPVIVISTLGVTQILAWGSSYYLLSVLARPIALATGWSFAWIVAGLSLGLVCAGIVSPRVGDAIQRRGGRPVLALSAVLLAAGLLAVGFAPALLWYLAAWIVVGAGMGAGLYDAAFATLGRLYGQNSRTAIGALTLFGGFASTCCWPLSAALVSHWGWRNACFTYAAIHLFLVLPLYLWFLPVEPRESPNQSHPHARETPRAIPTEALPVFFLVAIAITVSAMISTMVSVHLLTILQLRHIALAAAVALGALVGPTQVAARAIEMIISRFHHPLWTMLAATCFVALGVGALWGGWPIVALALVLYGAGIGIESIARATVPLAIFGHGKYAAIMGRIAMPSLIAQAGAPLLGAFLMERFGPGMTLAVLFAAALANVALVIALFMLIERGKRAIAVTAS